MQVHKYTPDADDAPAPKLVRDVKYKPRIKFTLRKVPLRAQLNKPVVSKEVKPEKQKKAKKNVVAETEDVEKDSDESEESDEGDDEKKKEVESGESSEMPTSGESNLYTPPTGEDSLFENSNSKPNSQQNAKLKHSRVTQLTMSQLNMLGSTTGVVG
jgi:hypothetical protein